MDAHKFVRAVEIAVRDGAVSEALQNLARPSGRRPPHELAERSIWYRGLSETDKEKLHEVLSEAVDQTIFGFLCVLDGVRSIEDGEQKGKLELRYVKEDVTLLNPSDGPMLHDLYRS